MAFKGLEEFAKKQREEWLSHVRPEYLILSTRKEKITLKEWREMRMNSYERQEMLKNLDNETLIYETEYATSQSRPGEMPPRCYDDAVIHQYTPLLIKRFKELQENQLPELVTSIQCLSPGDIFEPIPKDDFKYKVHTILSHRVYYEKIDGAGSFGYMNFGVQVHPLNWPKQNG